MTGSSPTLEDLTIQDISRYGVWVATNNNPAQGPDLDFWDTGLDPHDSFETGSVSTATEKVESRCDY